MIIFNAIFLLLVLKLVADEVIAESAVKALAVVTLAWLASLMVNFALFNTDLAYLFSSLVYLIVFYFLLSMFFDLSRSAKKKCILFYILLKVGFMTVVSFCFGMFAS